MRNEEQKKGDKTMNPQRDRNGDGGSLKLISAICFSAQHALPYPTIVSYVLIFVSKSFA